MVDVDLYLCSNQTTLTRKKPERILWVVHVHSLGLERFAGGQVIMIYICS